MKNIAFTICSNNYLAQAKVLSDSIFTHSAEVYDFYIILCDEFNDKIEYNEFHATFVEAKSLDISNFQWMTRYYDIIELNTAIKPYAFKYLIKKNSPNFIFYLDPDTYTYESLFSIEKEMAPDYSILLTPHSLAPLVLDGHHPADSTFLNYGIYNLGFLGIRVSPESNRMLDWWCDFLATHCLNDPKNGFFVDQLPMELVPLYFEGVKICRHKGINMAYWNLHERGLELKGGKYYLDSKEPLIMFHFSSLDTKDLCKVSKRTDRYSIGNETPLYSLLEDYTSKLKKTKSASYKEIPCVYTSRHQIWWKKAIRYLVFLIYKRTERLYQNLRRS